MPTDVTRLVKVGANVLQVVGEFAGKSLLIALSCRSKSMELHWSCTKSHTFL